MEDWSATFRIEAKHGEALRKSQTKFSPRILLDPTPIGLVHYLINHAAMVNIFTKYLGILICLVSRPLRNGCRLGLVMMFRVVEW